VLPVTEPQVDRPNISSSEACGNVTEAQQVNVTMWIDGGLVVIEAVPARVCPNCLEQYYDEATSQKIIKLANNGFPKRYVVREITVPVVSLDVVRPENASEDPQEGQET
jgi:YgiT-type zinc finger domain-containing protein